MVLSDTSGSARYARVDALEGGDFAVAWEASARQGDALGRTDIVTGRFDDRGNAVGPLRDVSPAIDDDFFAAEVSALPGGGWVVSYSGDEVELDGSLGFEGISARRFDEDGGARGGTLHLNVPHVGDQQNSRSVQLSNGDTVVVWDSELSTINEFGNPVDDMRGRILGPDGRPEGPEFVITTDNDGVAGGFELTRTDISVAALSGGRFVATWHSTELEGQADGDTSFQIRGRVFGPDGRPEGRSFQVDDHDDSVPDHSSVTALRGGGFMVTYDVPSPTHGAGEDVFAQVYSRWAAKVGSNVLVTSSPVNTQE